MARDYDEYAWHFRVLADAQRDGKLVFVLGAGVSVPYGLPNWQTLLANLLLNSGRLPRLPNRGTSETTRLQKEREVVAEILTRIAPDPLIHAEIARAAYPRHSWLNAVRTQLEPSAASDLASTPASLPRGQRRTAKQTALRSIARMLINAIDTNPHRHISVLTFNYDLLLESELHNLLKRPDLCRSLIHSISNDHEFERTWVNAGIYIYHLHGHIAVRPSRTAETTPVLDADSYVPVLQGNHWSWRCMERVLTATGNASLFIGLSLADPSLRYVLTRWGTWQTPFRGVYLAPPPQLPAVGYGRRSRRTHLDDQRTLALMYRTLMDLYSTVLDHLHLVCYHLSSWAEIIDILKRVENRHER